MLWRDVHSDAPGAAWLGLEGVVSAAARARPQLHMQAGARYFMRFMAGRWPLIWARIVPDHYGYLYLRSNPAPRSADLVLPPLTAVVGRAIDHDPGSDGWYAAWARVFLQYLETSPRSPLHLGSWWLTPCFAEERDGAAFRYTGNRWPRVPTAPCLEQTLSQSPHDYTDWDFRAVPPLALRGPSSQEDGRVKAWRKRFREGYFPPVLLMWITGLCRYVILDGHDRLHAALLEGHAPPMLALLSLRACEPQRDTTKLQAVADEVVTQLAAARTVHPPRGRPFSVESANTLLINAYDGRPRMTLGTTAWPLDGGVASWLEEVRGALRRVPPTTSIDLQMVAEPHAR